MALIIIGAVVSAFGVLIRKIWDAPDRRWRPGDGISRDNAANAASFLDGTIAIWGGGGLVLIGLIYLIADIW